MSNHINNLFSFLSSILNDLHTKPKEILSKKLG